MLHRRGARPLSEGPLAKQAGALDPGLRHHQRLALLGAVRRRSPTDGPRQRPQASARLPQHLSSRRVATQKKWRVELLKADPPAPPRSPTVRPLVLQGGALRYCLVDHAAHRQRPDRGERSRRRRGDRRERSWRGSRPLPRDRVEGRDPRSRQVPQSTGANPRDR